MGDPTGFQRDAHGGLACVVKVIQGHLARHYDQ